MKRALITGAADGIGRALGERLHGEGWSVCGLDVDRVQAAARPYPFVFCDLAAPAEIDAALDELAAGAPFELVVHNAGISCTGRFEETDPAAQAQVIAVNLQAPMLLSAGLWRRGLLARGTTIVFLSSLSHQVGYPSAAVYAATKDGLTAYARSLHVALGKLDASVLTVFPGPVRTAHARRYAPAGSDEERRMPPEAVAQAIAKALRRRRRILVPGLGPKLFAWAGRWLPGLTERAMKKALYDPLP
jgi:NAD(P)-dependent dehydrogenase (short-subunit alcohol dehydrogenase family)